MIPVGTLIFNIGLSPNKGGVLCRSAGTFGTVVAKGQEQLDEAERRAGEAEDQKPPTQRELQKKQRTADHVTVRLQSGEVRLINKDACATVGVASNPAYQYNQLGKAGRSRWKNIRPTVRGMAMNAADHPHGGGRGKSKGNVHPKSPWGLPVRILEDLHWLIKFHLSNTFFRPNLVSGLVPSGRSTKLWCIRELATRANVAEETNKRTTYNFCTYTILHGYLIYSTLG